MESESFTFTACKVGFPTLTWSTLPDDRVTVATIHSAPAGSRWCEIDLEPGDVVVWGPSAEHTARNVPGLELTVASIQIERMNASAQRLGTDFETPERGQVCLLDRSSAEAQAVGRALSNYAAVGAGNTVPGSAYEADLVRAVVHSATAQHPKQRIGAGKSIDSRKVARAYIDYADSTGRIPSISELCTVAHVSERRLRGAFTAEFDAPPTRFFRTWALAEARRRLVHHDLDEGSVTEVALDLGFEHLGRFSARYKLIYGETPSATLRSGTNESGWPVRPLCGAR